MALYCQKDEHLYHMFYRIIEDSNVSIGYLNRSSSILKLLDTQSSKHLLAQAISRPGASEMQFFFHATVFVE